MYAKVFRSLWDGTMGPNWYVWSTWVFILAHANRDGHVEMTQEAISARSGIPLDHVRRAILTLEAPDPRSRNPASEGRRLERLGERDWGWQIVNYELYRGMRDDEERRRQNREAQKRHKEKYSKPQSATLSQDKPRSAQAEAEAEGKNQNLLPDKSGEGKIKSAKPAKKKIESPAFAAAYDDWPRHDGRHRAHKAWITALREPRVAKKGDQAETLLMETCQEWAEYFRATRDAGFIPYLSSFLNAGTYLEAIPEATNGRAR